MLSEKYHIKDLLEAVKNMTFEDLERAVSQEYSDLAGSTDPFLNRDHLRHMTIVAQKKFTEQRNLLKMEYGIFLQHLRSFLKDEKAMGQFDKHDLPHLETLFRNIAIAENPRCGRYLAAVRANLDLHSKSQNMDRVAQKS
jgi:hypothetical protein